MKRIFLLILLFFSTNFHSQDKILDSLLKKLPGLGQDSDRVRYSYQISKRYRKAGKIDEAFQYANAALELTKKISYRFGLDICEENLGILYSGQGNFADALPHYFNCLKARQRSGDRNGEANAYTTIGNIFARMKNDELALENYNASIKIKREIGDSCGMGTTYLNMGNLFNHKNKHDEALNLYLKALSLMAPCKILGAEATINDNLGVLYIGKKDFITAEKYQLKGLALREKIGEKSEISGSLINLAMNYESMGQLKKALDMAKRGTEMAVEARNNEWAENGYAALSSILENMGDHKGALKAYKEKVEILEKLYNDESTKKALKLQVQYSYDKKSLSDSLHTAEEKRVTEIKHEEDIARQKIYVFIGAGGFLVMVVVAIFMLRAYRNKQKANIKIEMQKQMIETKQKEILDSIHYARRIQNAFLSSEKYISRKFKDLRKS